MGWGGLNSILVFFGPGDFIIFYENQMVLSVLIGFGFGSNFVLFAKASATAFGVANLGLVYPYVFLGYAIAGIAGPFSEGYLYDLSGNFSAAIYLAALMSLAGSLLFLISYIRKKRRQATR